MVQNVFVCFSSRQVNFVNWLIKARLINPMGCANVRHPILDSIEIQIQRYESNAVISTILQYIFPHLIGYDGRMRFNKMQRCGMIKPIGCIEEENDASYINFIA